MDERPQKKYHLGDWQKATEALAKMNKVFNAGQLGLTLEQFEAKGLV